MIKPGMVVVDRMAGISCEKPDLMVKEDRRQRQRQDQIGQECAEQQDLME